MTNGLTPRVLQEPDRQFFVFGSGQVCVDKMFGIYTGKRSYRFDGVDVLPVGEFLKRLYGGEVF